MYEKLFMLGAGLNGASRALEVPNFLKSIREVRARMLLMSPIFKSGVTLDFSSLKIGKNRLGLPWFFSCYSGVFSFTNQVIVSNNGNFFFTNVLTRVSRTLSLSANRFRNRQVNFVG